MSVWIFIDGTRVYANVQESNLQRQLVRALWQTSKRFLVRAGGVERPPIAVAPRVRLDREAGKYLLGRHNLR